ncbi:MAG: hypothetical protein ACBR15_24225 [Microcoleus sp.]
MMIQVKRGYRPQASDNSIEADIYLFDKLRQLSLKQRLEQAATLDRTVKKLSLIGIKLRLKKAAIAEIREHFCRAVLAENFYSDFQPIGTDEMMWIQDSIALAQQLHALLESINIPYYVGGGVASSIHGEARSTRDLDLAIQIPRQEIDLLVTTLENAGFYCPAGAVEELKQSRTQLLNITHTVTIANADIYIADNTPFALSQMSRRQLIEVEGTANFWVASPEDTIVQKLFWAKNSRSEKQWRDVLGILKLQGANLDRDYLQEWAQHLGVLDALTQAMTEAGI